jgi:F420-dependent oxidoreductase-like protein
MKFSFWPTPTQSFETMQSLGLHVEQTGWDGYWLADHLMPGTPDTSSPWFEAWTTLAGLAASVPRIRLGTLVTSNTFRHPAVLAKMAATVDHISGGRMVLGIGSGFRENEHQKYGIPFHTLANRLARLEETCQVVKALFNEPSPSFAGEFYQLKNATLEPKPKQQNLPLLIGGGGEKVTLKIAAKYADEWHVWGTVDKLINKMRILDRHCEACGRDPGEIKRSAAALLFLTDDEKLAARMNENNVTGGQATIAGNVAQLQEVIAAYKEAGVDELVVPDFTLRENKLDILDSFINDVAPAGR